MPENDVKCLNQSDRLKFSVKSPHFSELDSVHPDRSYFDLFSTGSTTYDPHGKSSLVRMMKRQRMIISKSYQHQYQKV